MRFFFDNCVSIKFVEVLAILAKIQEYELVHLTNKFTADAKDEDWIRSLAKDGDWVIISGDPRLSRSQAQRKAWQESGLTAFFLPTAGPVGDSGNKLKVWSTGGLRLFSKREMLLQVRGI